jgi:hypothetical protein
LDAAICRRWEKSVFQLAAEARLARHAGIEISHAGDQ